MKTGAILVVDDDAAVQEFVKLALSEEGYTVLTAANGAVALEVAAKHELSLILLDMAMPVMDGLAFLNVYCQQPNTQPPIIAFSANARNAPEMSCVQAFVAKPFDLDRLLELVKKHTSERKN
jgi:CheY-like chemotaxis protein